MIRRGGLAMTVASAFCGLALLACSLTGSGAATDTPAPPPPTSTVPPTAVPATATVVTPTATPPPTSTAVPATATLTPTAPFLLAIVGPDHKVGLVTSAGQAVPLAQAPGNLYALAYLSADLSQPSHAYSIGPQGVKELSFVNNSSDGFASFTGPAAPQGEVAWDHYNPNSPSASSIDSDIFLANTDGSGLHSVLHLKSDHVLHVVRFSRDGNQLYYSQEPLGLGGYILFGGVSDLWLLVLGSGKSTQVVPDAAAGVICLDDFASDASLVAFHCKKEAISVLDTSTGGIGLIAPPANVTDWSVHGDARLSPDQSHVAYALARGNPDSEQGWVAVGDDITGTSRLIATAPAGDFFSVKGWLDNSTLVLQSHGDKPGVWIARADGSDLKRIADGVFLGGG